MPKKWMAKLVLSAVLCLLGFPSWGADELKILAHDIAPYAWRENGRPQGYAYALVQQLMREMNEKTPIEFVSFRRAMATVQDAGQFAVFPYARTPEREQTVKWVGPIIEMSVYMFKRKGEKIRLERLDDLRRMRGIGVQLGIRDDAFLTSLKLNNVFRMESQSQALRALLNRRVDVIPLSSVGIKEFLQHEKVPPDAIESTGFKLFDNNLYIAFSRDVSDATIARWQQALDRIKTAPQTQRADKPLSRSEAPLRERVRGVGI